MNRRELLKVGTAGVAAEVLKPLARVSADGPVEALPDGLRVTLQTGEIAVVWGNQITGPDLNPHGERRPNREVVYAVASKEDAMRLEFRGQGLKTEVNLENTGVHNHMVLDGATWEVGTARMQAEFARRRRERNPLRAILLVRRSASRDPETGGLLLDPLEERHLDERGVEIVFEQEIVPVQPAAPVAPAPAPRVEAPATRAEVRILGFPTTREEAASAFGKDEFSKDPNRWELSADGGWHFKEGPVASSVDPKGFVLEGYRDTKPGKNADAFVSNGVEVSMQGGTIWSIKGEGDARKLLAKVSPVTWDDGTVHPPRPIGFSR